MGSTISRDEAERFVETVEAKLRAGYAPKGVAMKGGQKGALAMAAEELGINRSSVSSKIASVEAAYRKIDWGQYRAEGEGEKKPDFDLPVFPDGDIEVEKILDYMSGRFKKKLAREDSKTWFEVKVNIPGPVGIAVVGDPHLGTHCNIDLLRRDVDIMATTEGMMAVNIGDTTDNWGGRLIALYAEDDISRPTERRLARWFLQDAGIPWVAWLHGNHDTMHSEFATFLKTANTAQIPMVDWRAKFELLFPGGGRVKIDAAHNHKGTSIYNRLHGQKRAALWDEDADIYVAGHHHTWGLTHEEMQDGRVVWMGRARGYKWIDEYAVRHNFSREENGATILFVIDPGEKNAVRRISAFADLEEGADFLTWKRARAKK